MINSNKYNFLSYNGTNVVIIINGQNLEKCTVTKYLGIYFDNNLFLNSYINYVKIVSATNWHI